MSLSPSRKRAVAVLPLLALVAGACVKPDAPGIKVSPIEASLVFGVKEKPPVPVSPFDPVDLTPEEPGDDFVFEPLDPPVNLTLPTVSREFCPKAPPSAAVETPTEVDITGDPQQGLTRWKVDAYVTNPDGSRATAKRRYEGRIIRNFKEVPPDADPRYQAGDKVFTFQMVQPSVNSKDVYIVSTYEVRTTSLQNRPSLPAGPVQPPTAGQPERGLVLKRIESEDRNGQSVGQPFVPTTGLLLLPLPVTSAERFQSSAVDPKNGRSLALDATVTQRARIDACGDLVDGWLVDGQLLDSTQPSPEPLGYSFIVATQFGGQMISERFTQAGSTAIYELGQLKPTPR